MSKYKMPEPHEQRELMIAQSNGAIIEEKNGKDWMYKRCVAWWLNHDRRIQPNCQYALSKIAELGGDEMVEIYQAWLDGAEIGIDDEVLCCYPTNDIDDQFEHFISLLKDSKRYGKVLCLKKKKFKQVLWVLSSNVRDGSKIVENVGWCKEGEKPIDNINSPIDTLNGTNSVYYWHKVPTATREVEV